MFSYQQILKTRLTPTELHLPNKINNIQLARIDWRDFRGDPDPQSPYFAHIFWKIDYELIWLYDRYTLEIDVKILNNSWVSPGKETPELLLHEYGHYLIGCLCALTFKNRLNNQNINKITNEFAAALFQSTLKDFLKVEIAYDEATAHGNQVRQQQEWMKRMIGRLQLIKGEEINRSRVTERGHTSRKEGMSNNGNSGNNGNSSNKGNSGNNSVSCNSNSINNMRRIRGKGRFRMYSQNNPGEKCLVMKKSSGVDRLPRLAG